MIENASDSILLTGCGWVTPFACGTIHEVLGAAHGVRATPPPAGGVWSVPDDLRSQATSLSKELARDAGAWMTAVAFEHASRDAALDGESLERQRVGLVLGCAFAGQSGMIGFAQEIREQTGRFVSPINFPQTVGNYVSGALARGYHILGPNVTLASGVPSGLDAMVEGMALLVDGAADVVFAGGTERLWPGLTGALAEPDTVLSEGACLFVMERGDQANHRGARALALLSDAAQSHTLDSAGCDAGQRVLSIATGRHAGAVVIEYWIGRCFAALGAATVAAAIGAARGLGVPWIDPSDVTRVSTDPMCMEDRRDAEGRVIASALAHADKAHQTRIDLLIPIKA